MTNYKKKDGVYTWEITPEDDYTLVRNVIPAMIWGRGCRLHSINGYKMNREADQFCHCISALYKYLESAIKIALDVDIVGCRCNITIECQENNRLLKIALANAGDKDTKIERKMLRHINGAMNAPKDICFPDLQN